MVPGETVRVVIEKKGTGQGQGVARLEDGTMVIVENAGNRVGQTLTATIRNTTQTNAGRLIFARVDESNDKVDPATTGGDDDLEEEPVAGQIGRYTRRRRAKRGKPKTGAGTT